MEEAQKYINKSISEIADSDLPKEWDWRDVKGFNFGSELKDQGGCGSCFTFSFIATMEMRIKIKYGRDIKLSPLYFLSCNFLNEGCEGGWPILNGIFAESFSIPEDSCHPYSPSPISCDSFSHCKPAARVNESVQIGGFYGNASEIAMMKEIRARGPIVSDIEPPLSFSVYKSGVFSDEVSKSFKELTEEVQKEMLKDD